MVYLVELLVVMTDWRKIVIIRARNVLAYTELHFDDDARLSHLSLARSRKATVSRADAPRSRPAETYKIVSRQPAHVWQWPLSKKVVATVCPLYFDTKSEQSDCNKFNVK